MSGTGWWRRTDGEPGIPWQGAGVLGLVLGVGMFGWLVLVRHDGVVLAAVVSAISGMLMTLGEGFGLRDRGRRSGYRDVERVRAWRERRRER